MRSRLLVSVLSGAVIFLLATNPMVVNAAGNITGTNIKNNSLTGKDIREKSLQQVPDAAELDGKPAAAYRNTTFQFRLTGPTETTEKVFTFPDLPSGKYIYSWSVLASTAGGVSRVTCQFSSVGANIGADTSDAATLAHQSTSEQLFTSNAAGSASVSAYAQLRCAAHPGFTIYSHPSFPSTMTFTRVETILKRASSTP